MSSFLEPHYEFRNFLRKNLTDLNSANRGGANWIYADQPEASISSKNVYPRIIITKIVEGGEPIGLSETTTYDDVVLQVEVIMEKKSTVLSYTSTDESLGVISNAVRLSFKYAPNTVTNIKHNGTAFGTVTAKNSDSVFTTPASLAAGTVEWSRETGNLNFSSADLTSYAAQTITATYVLNLDATRAVQWISRQMVEKTRTLWRTDTEIGGLHYPKKISGPFIPPFDRDPGLVRSLTEYGFKRFNTGENV